MKKKYLEPVLEITEFISEDILTASSLLLDKFDMSDAAAGSIEASIGEWSYTEGDTNTIQVR